MSANRKKLLFIAGLSVLLMVIILAGLMIKNVNRVSTDDAYIEGRVHSVASRVGGTVIKLHIDDNQSVKKGELLLEIDPADYELKVNQAQADLNAEKARLLDAEASIKTAMANIRIQTVTLNQASIDKKRAGALYKEQVITKEKNERASTAYNLAAAQLKAAAQGLQKARSVKTLQESVIKEKEAALNIAKLNLGYTRVYSPSDGYVTRKSVETGNQIQSGQPLMAVVALDDIWVVANFKETQLRKMKPGQEALIQVDTFPGQVFRGKVDSIMAGTGAFFSLFPPENALGNYVKVVQRVPVKIVLDKAADKRHVLRIGMSCMSTVITRNE